MNVPVDDINGDYESVSVKESAIQYDTL
jgi:hypothetical protein